MKLFLSFSICIVAIILAIYSYKPTVAFEELIPAELQSRVSTLLSRYLNNTNNNITSKDQDFITEQPPITLNNNMTARRAIRLAFEAFEQSEGVGARVRRTIGTPKLRNLTPFLMLDYFSSSSGSGFPDHPHRGQETITYLLSGAFDHEDFAGNKGSLYPGDLQFMTAGRGIMHSEMPRDNPDGSPNVGFQLWVDLPKELKNTEPRYRDLRAKEIPIAEVDDGKVIIKVISGQSHGVDSVRDLAYTPVWYLDITIKPGGRIKQVLPIEWNAFTYVLQGTAHFVADDNANNSTKTKPIKQHHIAVFEQAPGDHIEAFVPEDATEDARFMLFAGQPLDQPVVQYGPFVCTSREEVQQALIDFQTGQNGFERSVGWESEIGKRMVR